MTTQNINIFNYYLIRLNETTQGKTIEIYKDVPIIKNSLPNLYLLKFKKLSYIIEPNILPVIVMVSFENYNHTIIENTFKEGLTSIVFHKYEGDLNKCIFPKSLEFISIYQNYNITLTDKFFTNNPNVKKIYLNAILDNEPNYNLYSTNKCEVYINGILKKTVESENYFKKHLNILELLNIDKEIIELIKQKNNIDNSYAKNRLELITKLVMTL